MNDASRNTSARLLWLPSLSALATFIACKGTILLVAMFPLLGFTLTINTTAQAAVISVFAILTSMLVFANFARCGKKRGPVILVSAGALLVVGAMYIHFDIIVEAIGLAALLLAAIWSGLAGRRSATATYRVATN